MPRNARVTLQKKSDTVSNFRIVNKEDKAESCPIYRSIKDLYRATVVRLIAAGVVIGFVGEPD